MIKITLKNSQEVVWKKEEFDDYIYDGRFFIIIKGPQWIGFYNLDSIISVTIQN